MLLGLFRYVVDGQSTNVLSVFNKMKIGGLTPSFLKKSPKVDASVIQAQRQTLNFF